MFYNYILLSYTHTQIRGRERVYHIMIITCVSKKSARLHQIPAKRQAQRAMAKEAAQRRLAAEADGCKSKINDSSNLSY